MICRTGHLVVSVVLLCTACAGSQSSSACTAIERIVEPGASAIHVLDGDSVTFELSPPTSGPHQLPAPLGGVSVEPIPEARQISALEVGRVIIQYSPAVDADGISALSRLSSADVIVAPAVRTLDDEALVALTAWSHRSLCSAVDIDAAEDFIEERVGVFFVGHEGAPIEGVG